MKVELKYRRYDGPVFGDLDIHETFIDNDGLAYVKLSSFTAFCFQSIAISSIGKGDPITKRRLKVVEDI